MGSFILRVGGALIVVLGLFTGLMQKDVLNMVVVTFTFFVLGAVLIAIAQIRDLTHETWKKVIRIENELSNRSRRR